MLWRVPFKLYFEHNSDIFTNNNNKQQVLIGLLAERLSYLAIVSMKGREKYFGEVNYFRSLYFMFPYIFDEISTERI